MYERYIKEADARLAIMDYIGSVADCKLARDGAEGAMYAIETAPTADVVPKSEVEKLYKEIDRLSQVVLYHDSFKADEIKDARQEVAMEIFEEIANVMVLQHGFNEKHIVAHIDFELLKELKKKYTEGEG